MNGYETDIVIVGGGIAGLFALNRLRSLGYSVVLLEANALGGGQTIKSQGIIHGGIKFALKGFLTNAANSIETMPKFWQECLQGTGLVDLRAVKILSKDQFLWSTGSISSELTAFFASQALNSRVKKLSFIDYPDVFKTKAFKGQVWRLDEVVLDIPSLIQTLRAPHESSFLKIEKNNLKIVFEHEQNIKYLELTAKNNNNIQLTAKHYLFVAGEGNAELLSQCRPMAHVAMQCRPLQMVLLKLNQPHALYAHCIDNGVNPRITITSHTTKEGKAIWYLGGQIAETGVNKSQASQLQFAKLELQTLFPWLDFSAAEWASFLINRAEPLEIDGKRPDSAFVETKGNLSIAWPCKLALAPLLSDKLIESLKKESVTPSRATLSETNLLMANNFDKPKNALPIWEEIQYHSV